MRYLIFLLIFSLFPGTSDPAPITIFLAGDSTMAPKQPDKRPETGWGEALQGFFDASRVRVSNHARNGRSTRSFIEEGRWQAIIDSLSAGDYVFIQFGHNDQKVNSDRYASPEQYANNLIRFIEDVRARQATPVLLTPVVRRRFDENGQFYDTHGDYPDAVRRVAQTHQVALIDMHQKSERVLRGYGEARSTSLFLHLPAGEHAHYPAGIIDDTHFSPNGATVMAREAVKGIQEAGLDLADLLRMSVPVVYDAVVDSRHTGNPGEMLDGTATFQTIGAALETVPEDNARPFQILIKEGRYYEKLVVNRPHVHLVGQGQESTVLTYDTAAGTPGPDGEPLGTSGSFTLKIAAPDFYVENLTIENGFDYAANEAKAEDDPTKLRGAQAVAVMTTDESDRAVFRNCTISGYQDSLFINAGRHYFYQCRILGHVDFIFGAGRAVFDDSDIVSRNRPDKNPTGYITAPSTPISYPYGFLFIESRFLKESPALQAGSVRLGRPWHPGSNLSASGSAVFLRCYMDDHLGMEGYAPISGRNEAGERIWFEVEPDSRFFEFGNYGPGALESPERPMLSAETAAWYTPQQVLNGWVPEL